MGTQKLLHFGNYSTPKRKLFFKSIDTNVLSWKNKDTYIALPLYFFKTVFYLLISLCLKKHIALFYWFSLYSNSVFIIVLLKFTWIDHSITQRPGPENSKKFRQKNSCKQINQNFCFREIAFLAVLNFFSSSEIDFWPFLNLQKMEFDQNKISWNWFIWFHEFFWPGLL